ncbi:MAG: copper resistance CopC family protein [Gemmatimonadota bacterium]
MRRLTVSAIATAALVGATALTAAADLHLELRDSRPEADAALERPPEQVRLWFNVAPDTSRTTVSLRGPNGSIEMGKIQTTDDPTSVVAPVLGEDLPAGAYTVVWVGAEPGDHTVRGRFEFEVASGAH